MRKKWAIALILTVTAFVVPWMGLMPGFGQSNQTLVLDGSVSPQTVLAGEDVRVTLSIKGDLAECNPIETRLPLDVTLVIDHSGSMQESLGDNYSGTKLDGALSAIQSFTQHIDPQLDRVALIGYSDKATVFSKMGNGQSVVSQFGAVRSTQSGGTDIASGLKEAQALFSDEQRADAYPVIILLTDGLDSNVSATAKLAVKIKEGGVKIVTIGLGPDVDANFLTTLASEPNDYYYAPSTSALENIFTSIAENIKTYSPASDITVRFVFDVINFDLIEDSVKPTPSNVTVDAITWHFDKMDDLQKVFTIDLNSRLAGVYDSALNASISYLACGENLEKSKLSASLPVTVTDEGGGLSCQTKEQEGRSLLDLICNFNYWGWIGGLLFGLAALFYWLRKFKDEWRSWFRCRIKPRRCMWAWLPMVLWTAILAGSLLNALANYACSPHQGILFWRIFTDRSMAVMVKPTKPDLTAKNLTPVYSETEWLGFYDFSEESQKIVAITQGTNGLLSFFSSQGDLIKVTDIQGSYPTWSPDGKLIAYAANNQDIYILEYETGMIMPLAGASEPNVIETMPAWNSDGSKIAFVKSVGSLVDNYITIPSDIMVISSSGGVPQLIPGASGLGFNYYPAFSPDGKWLAFTFHSTGKSASWVPEAEIRIIPSDGGASRKIQANYGPGGQDLPEAGNVWPTWSKDSKTIYFSSRRCGEQPDIFSATLDANGNTSPALFNEFLSAPDSHEYKASEVSLKTNLLASLLKLWPLFIPLLINLLIIWFICRSKPDDKLEDTLELTVEAEPPTQVYNRPSERLKVNMSLAGKEICEKKVLHKESDVVLVIDSSGSMNDKDMGIHSRLEASKSAAKRFINCVLSEHEKIAVVSFGDEAKKHISFTNDVKNLLKAIADIHITSSTNMAAGLQEAMNIFEVDGRPNVVKSIILLSDGAPNDENETYKVAEELRNKEVRILAVGVGEAREDILRNISGDSGSYKFVHDYEGLIAAFMEFGRQLITPVPARDVTFTHTIDTSRFKLISNSITPTPFEIINDEKIVWKFFEVTKKPVYFSYLVQPIRDGSACIDLESKLSYLRCENKPHRDQLVPSKASVDVFPYGKKEPRPPHKEYVIKEAEPIWQPDHALFISIGHFGRKMLTYVRKNLLDAGNGKMPKGCEFLVVDTAGYESLEGLGNPVAFAGVEIPSADVFMLDENLTKKVENWSNGVPLPDYLTGWFRPDDFVGLGQELNLSAGLFSHRAIPRVALLRHIMKATDINSQWMNEHPKASLEDMVTERVLRLLQENKDLRIFILGALGDGMSGTLIDLTVLIRKNALKTIPEENELHVEGYFLDGPSILKMVPDHRIKEIYLANAYASLREINRWQTARGQRLTLPCISEPLTSGLFDEFIMFTKGKEDNLFMDGFPVMADIVTARLDKATGAGTKNDWFDVMHETRTFRINREHENVVTCANAFTLRLPVNDILRTIHMKWIRQLLIKFLSHNNSGDILFDPNNINDPGIPDDPGVLGCKFLNGEEGISDSSPIESKIIGELINNKTCEKEENSYSSQTWVQKSDDEVKREFEARLAKVVFQIVEGTLESDQGSNAGRLAYAIDFVSKLKNAIDELSGRLAGKPILFRIVSLYQEILYNQGDRLSKLKASLYEDKPDQPPGVYQIIEKDYRGLEKIKDELDQIGSRKYFWGNSTTLDDIEKDENSFVYSWYRDYLSPYYEDCKDLIGWSKTDQEQIDLSVRIKDHPIGLLENGTEAFIDALTQKAENLTRGALAQSSLLNILASHRLLNNDDIGKRLREQVDLSTSRLFISVDPGINAGVLYRMAIPGIEQGIVHTEFMNGLNQDPTDSAIALGEATPLASTDQFAITLLRLIDAVRVDRLRSSVSSKDAYLQSKDQINSVQYEEVTAKLIERLEHYPHDVNAVIHPFVVQALANPDNAELFCLALAEGFIKVDPGDRIVLEIGQLNELITNERRNYIDQIIDAMIIFSENKDQKFTGHIRWLTTHYDSNQNIDRDRLIKWANWPANIDEPWMNELPENRSLQMLLKTFTTNYLRSRRRWMN